MELTEQCFLVQDQVLATELVNGEQYYEVSIDQRDHELSTKVQEASCWAVVDLRNELLVVTEGKQATVNEELNPVEDSFRSDVVWVVVEELLVLQKACESALNFIELLHGELAVDCIAWVQQEEGHAALGDVQPTQGHGIE